MTWMSVSIKLRSVQSQKGRGESYAHIEAEQKSTAACLRDSQYKHSLLGPPRRLYRKAD